VAIERLALAVAVRQEARTRRALAAAGTRIPTAGCATIDRFSQRKLLKNARV